MKIKNAAVALFAAFSASTLVAAMPVIRAETVSFSQTPTRLVTIGYTLEEADAIITVDILTNGVSIGAENYTNMYGDVNVRVSPGNRIALWQPRKSWPDHVFNNNEVSVEVKAWDVAVPPDYMVIDLVNRSDAPRYYTCEEALPGGRTNEIYLTKKLVMRRIPAAGNIWTMGSPATEPGRVASRETQRLVTMTNDFFMGIYTVTRGQQFYAGVLNSISQNATNLPVVVSYNNLRDAGWPTNGYAVVSGRLKTWRDNFGIDFDLPTSAQWEFACRAGHGGAFFFDDDGAYTSAGTSVLALLNEYGWYWSSSETTCVPGQKKANPYGLYDLYGNVWEWCLDWVDQPSADAVVEPAGPKCEEQKSGDEGKRVQRGGQRESEPQNCRSAKVNPAPDSSESASGYRLVCPITLKW